MELNKRSMGERENARGLEHINYLPNLQKRKYNGLWQL